ncbi:MAG: cysteine desulfurase [Simkaniaceae bacterium]
MDLINSSLDVQRLRKDFPVLQQKVHGFPLIYLDTAATAQKPHAVIQAMSHFYAHQYGTVHRGAYHLSVKATDAYFAVRQKVKDWIHAASEEEIIFTKGTTDAINLVASSYGRMLQAGDEIILTVMEHHSNIVPWQLLAEQKHLKIHYVPIDAKGELDLGIFAQLLSKKTKIVSLAHVANSTGTVNPIEQVISLVRKTGAVVVIDGAQAAPHMPLDMQKLDADFYAFSGHKLYGPTGVGVLYGKKHLLEKMPPYQGGGDMIDAVSLQKTTYAPPPQKFEAGTPMIAEVIGLGAAMDYLKAIGMEAIQLHEQKLLDYAAEQLQQVPGMQFIGTAKEKGAILSFIIEGLHPLDIASLLNAKGIAIRTGHLCAQPTLEHFGLKALCRASFGLYNTKEEIDLLFQQVKKIQELLK